MVSRVNQWKEVNVVAKKRLQAKLCMSVSLKVEITVYVTYVTASSNLSLQLPCHLFCACKYTQEICT
jgi:hypothetical protein